MHAVSTDQCTVRYGPETATLTVQSDGWEFTGSIAVETDGGTLPADSSVSTTALADGTRILHDDWCNTAVDIEAVDGGVDVTLTLHNTSDTGVTVGDLKPFVAEHPAAFQSGVRLYENGYRSSTPTGTLPVGTSFDGEHARTAPLILDPAAPDEARTSHYVTALSATERSVALGFLDYSTYVTRFDCYAGDDDGVERLAAVCPADGRTLAPGERIESAPLRLDVANDVPAALEAIASEAGERMDARVPETATTGWCSWYAYYQDVTQDDVLENLDAIEERALPLDVVQLDDGYQETWGDWLSVNDRFDDLDGLREEIESRSHTPGIWLAPFLVYGDSRLAAEHPEWLVDCEERLTRWAVTEDDETRRYALDTTHPGAQRWLRTVFDTVVNEWGYDFLKLDFTFTAAFPGDRFDDDATRAEAYRRGYEVIRDVCGDETTILSVDLVGTTVGLADAMRVGQDARHWWAQPPDGVLLGEHSGGGTRNGLRNTLNRQFMHRQWWVTDPDHQLFGVSDTAGGTGQAERTAAEKRTFAAVVALSGGVNLVSDVVSELDEDDVELLRRTLPPIDGGSVRGLGATDFPDRLYCERADGAVTVAACNWADEARTVTIDSAEYGIEDAICWDAWENEILDTGREFSRTVPPHGCLLALLAPSRDRPQLLGSPDHLAGGTSLVSDVIWSVEREELTVQFDAEESMTVAVTEPGDWRVDSDGRVGDVARVRLEPGENHLSEIGRSA